ncbi:BamA/TamA family outer membrane protein [Chitinophaga sp. CF118]|uniref:BamA/TamA family outer membrane protein n=1 Tax=Chitinophaga sp. CF118 TaxID=1884367 RepID=UPI00210137F8|nr:BamA/TamA family outer membrane protein [Chitinophaga sp. CF118]
MVHKILLAFLFFAIQDYAYSQIATPADSSRPDKLPEQGKQTVHKADNLDKQFDISDLLNDILHPKKKTDSLRKRSGITVVPNIAANPTIGFQIGIKAVAGKVLGREPNTYMSIAATSASITTKGIIYFYISHNVFTPGNRWNFQGSLVAAKSVTPDFGLGMGHASGGSPADSILANPGRKAYVWNSQYYKFFEKVYKEVGHNLFLGAGVAFDIRRKISNARHDTSLTPYKIYNERFGFVEDHYLANGFLFNIQYNTRDNPNRAYKGIYVDAGLRANQTWIGSSKNALQLTFDFRKYFSLSERTPEHVIAFWSWGAGVLSGAVPYLELPGTSRDPSFRSGRGYVSSYYKGTQFFYSETEYRFPITRNKLFSGVAFVNIETSNDKASTKLLEIWKPAAGAGLRILFNKTTRTNLCLDYAFGAYGSKGFFLNLNETF